MSETVVTVLEIDSDTRGADEYSQAMDKASASTKRTAQEQRDLQLAVAGVSVAMVNAMRQQSDAANDNSRAMRMNGLEVASFTNHLKQMVVAAYAVSPAFRQLVNPAITASVNATTMALSAMGPVAASAGMAALKGMAPLLSLFGRILLPITLVIDAVRAMNYVTELGAQKLKELGETSSAAAAAGVTAEYFQRVAKGADELAIKSDLATDALKRFKAVSDEQLGGSAFESRLDALVKAGNFVENTGVAAYKQAATTEEKYRAASEIVTIAIERGERLAGLDLASKFLPPDMMERLKANGELLRDLQRAADQVKPADIVSQEQVGYAAELQHRLEQANKIIEDRMKPVHKDLTQLGLNYQESWVYIVELKAKAASLIVPIYMGMKSAASAVGDIARGFDDFIARVASYVVPSWLQTFLKVATLPVRMAANDPAVVEPKAASTPEGRALRGWLDDAAAVQSAMKDVNTIVYKVQKDISKPVVSGAAQAAQETKDSFSRALESTEKHTARMIADTQAVGLGAGALEEFRARASLVTAAQQAGIPITDALTAKIEAQAKAAGVAGEALARARINNQIAFDRATIGLSQEDVQIAQQLRSIYPDVTTALNSAEAADMRLNNRLREGNQIVSDFGNTLLSSFLRGESAAKSMTGAAVNLIQTLASKNLQNFLNGGSLFGNQSLTSAQGALGMAGAGLSGYQSGNALTGALGGAMAGATFGPMGAVAGGILGLVGGIFGASDQSRKKIEEAQRVWKEAGPAFQTFLNEMSGGMPGGLSTNIPPKPSNDNKQGDQDDRDQRRQAA